MSGVLPSEKWYLGGVQGAFGGDVLHFVRDPCRKTGGVPRHPPGDDGSPDRHAATPPSRNETEATRGRVGPRDPWGKAETTELGRPCNWRLPTKVKEENVNWKSQETKNLD